MFILDKSLKLAIKSEDNRLDKLKTKKDLVAYLFCLLEDVNDQREFSSLISLLRNRKWDVDYNYLSNIKL